jgi:hypothetical protein
MRRSEQCEWFGRRELGLQIPLPQWLWMCEQGVPKWGNCTASANLCKIKKKRIKAGTVVKSVVDRCSTNTNQCEENIDLTAKCGLAFTRSDNQTYYFNCGGAGAECIYRISQCNVWTTYVAGRNGKLIS